MSLCLFSVKYAYINVEFLKIMQHRMAENDKPNNTCIIYSTYKHNVTHPMEIKSKSENKGRKAMHTLIKTSIILFSLPC